MKLRHFTYCLWCLICVWHVNKVQAQSDSLPLNVFAPSLNVYAGSIIKAYPNVPNSKYALLAGLAITWQTQGKDNWHQLYKFPKMGAEIVFADFGNPSYLGQAIGFVPTLELKGNKGKRWRFKAGFGAAYYNKPYDVLSNPNNFYIGGHYTNMSIFSLFWQRDAGKNLLFNYGITAFHSSNGHTTLPNAGMNMITGGLGISFKSSTQKHFHKTDSLAADKLSYAVKFGLGFHEFGATTKPVGGPTYPSYHLSVWVNKPFRHSGVLQAGLVWAYYTSYYDYIISQQLYDSHQYARSFTGVLFGGHEFVFGKFSFSAQAGLYVYNPFYIKQKKAEGTWDNLSEKLEGINTNRIGLNYYPFKKHNSLNHLNKQLQIGIYLKANVAQADLFEYCVGYVF
jgi:hypothetical protein